MMYIMDTTLWQFKIAIENGPSIVDVPFLKMLIFHSYVSLPEGTSWLHHQISQSHPFLNTMYSQIWMLMIYIHSPFIIFNGD